MDIRKFFGGSSNVRSTEKLNNQPSKSSESTKRSPQKNSRTSKRNSQSPMKPPSKDKTYLLKSPTKRKVEVVSAPKQTGVKCEDSENDFSGARLRTEINSKTKGNQTKGRQKEQNETVSATNKGSAEIKQISEAKINDSHNNNDNKLFNKRLMKKRKHEKESMPQTSSEEDEEPIAEQKSSSKLKRKRAVIYDSDSDEDPLPKHHKEKSTGPKGAEKREMKLDSGTMAAPIMDAFSKVVPKLTKNSERCDVTTELKHLVNPIDYFGSSPIQRTERRQQIKIQNKVDVDEFPLENEDLELPTKKIKLDKVGTEVQSLSDKLAIKKKLSEKNVLKKLLPFEDEKPKFAGETSANAKKSPIKTSPEKPKSQLNTIATPVYAKNSSTSEMDIGSTEKGQMQKKGSSFLAYKNREPPKALGMKEVPQGADNCLEGLTFVITGVLESIERDEAKSLVERHGGKVMQNVSKNTKYLVVGRDSGEAKLSKAAQLGIKQLDEDGLFNLIRTLPGKKSKYEVAAAKEETARKTSFNTASAKSTPVSSKDTLSSKLDKTTSGAERSETSRQSSQATLSPELNGEPNEALLWVDRYKPTNSKQIIGQQGDKSNAKKLFNWLSSWHKNLGKKPVFGRTSDDGAGHRAALLSGPPGVGKTTTAQIICKEAGFSYIELNASDTRSKRSLKEEVAEALNNHTLADFFGQGVSRAGSATISTGQRHCLLMDEVDGMAGNEDRGGMQELIQLIKNTKIPVICMCNDRSHPKVRSLSNYCFDLRFQRPRIEQIKGAMMSIAYKEGLKIPPPALNDVILAANQDIRQVLHNLSMWTAKDKTLTYEQLKQDSNKAQKDLHLGPFDVCRKVFAGGEETSKMTINDKSDLFFHDYSIGPLFVQENYINVTPFSTQGNVLKHLRCLSRAADSIATGDLVDAYVRRKGNWNLLPTQAIFASVLPGDVMRGSVGQMIQFPSWLGKNSTTSKNDRLHQELRNHMKLNISADKLALGQDYLPALRLMLTSPLVNEGTDGVAKTVAHLDAYDLLREDFDSIVELTSWPGMKDLMSQVESKVKAAFTRTYNKEVHLTPYATGAAVKKGQRRGANVSEEDYELELDDGVAAEESEQSDDDVSADTMIKAKKAAPKTTKSSSLKNQDVGVSKGKGKGKGRGSKKSN